MRYSSNSKKTSKTSHSHRDTASSSQQENEAICITVTRQSCQDYSQNPILSRVYVKANGIQLKYDYDGDPASFLPSYDASKKVKGKVWKEVLNDVQMHMSSQPGANPSGSYSFPTGSAVEATLQHDHSCAFTHDGMKIDRFVYKGKTTSQQEAKHARATSYGKLKGAVYLHLPTPITPTELVDITIKGTVSQIAATMKDGLGPVPPAGTTHSRFCVAHVNGLSIRFTCGTFQTGNLSTGGRSPYKVNEVLDDPAFASSSNAGTYTAN